MRKSLLYAMMAISLIANLLIAIAETAHWSIGDLDATQAAFGRYIDVFTQRGGRGISSPSNPFGPKEVVIIYAITTFNQWPVQNIAVSFEIHDPHDSLWGVFAGRSNETGTATTSFRLPFSADNQSCFFGSWIVICTAEIASEIVSDILVFEYEVDVLYLARTSAAFGSYLGHPKWNPHCDIWGPYREPDGVIDIMDLAVVSANFGKYYGQ